VSIGAFFNVLDPDQMLLWHIMLLPLLVGFLIVAHVILVRRHGVVPPFDAVPPAVLGETAAGAPDAHGRTEVAEPAQRSEVVR